MTNFWNSFGIILYATLIYATPLLYAALGSCFSEVSGVVNIGIEGMMTAGAFTGTVIAYFTGNPWIGFLCGGLAGAFWAEEDPEPPLVLPFFLLVPVFFVDLFAANVPLLAPEMPAPDLRLYFAVMNPFSVSASAQSTAPPAAPLTVLWARPMNL